jgi:hypothetical protein
LKPFFGVRGLDPVLLPLCPADVCLHGRSFTVSPSHFSPTPFTHTSHIHTLLVHTPSSAILMQRTTFHAAAAAPSPADCCSQTTLMGAPSRATSIVESRPHDYRRNDEAMSCQWRSPDERAVRTHRTARVLGPATSRTASSSPGRLCFEPPRVASYIKSSPSKLATDHQTSQVHQMGRYIGMETRQMTLPGCTAGYIQGRF